MRSLLLHVHEEPRFDARLQVALDLARAFDGHISLYQPIPLAMLWPGDPFAVTATDLAPMAKDRAEEYRRKIEIRLAAEDVPWNWVSEFGVAEAGLVEQSGLADLAIVGAGNTDGRKGASRLAGTLAIQSLAPILVVPDTAEGFAADGAAVVAWDGSLEASRALRSAVPLLQKASAVTLVEVEETKQREVELPMLDGARYLDRHGIACEIVQIGRGDASITHVLREAARAREAGLLVMGAYGVPRVVETLFGGVTRDMLTNPDIPVFLSH
ncbi:MAG: universal stress protein [Erythrobacter sp.]|nr:MAG: universal stress protein [Erythrobacter sp.]